MRTSCDIDILILEQDLERAVALLAEKLSYRTNEYRNYHDVSLFSPSGVHLELHFSLKETYQSLDGVLSRAWEFSESAENCSYQKSLSIGFFLFYQIAHLSYHFRSGGCGVRYFLDLYYITQKFPASLSLALPMLKESDLIPFSQGVLHLTDVWFRKQSHNEVSLGIQEFVLNGGLHGNSVNRITLFRQRSGGKISYALSRIFLKYDVMKEIYPVLKRYPILLPICHVRRWIHILLDGRLHRVISEFRVNSKISAHSDTDLSDLFRRLGL